MTAQGARTRERLITATTSLVREIGYSNVTTRLIARTAGVAEGTLYRHFPDKSALFHAAIAHQHAPLFASVAGLPGLAGRHDVITNLADALTELAQLREDMLPLELAILADPELARSRQQLPDPAAGGPDPAADVVAYLAAEQALGRIAADVDPRAAAMTLLAALFGLALAPHPEGVGIDPALIRAAVTMLVDGIGVPSA